jgi:hypothetical protein
VSAAEWCNVQLLRKLELQACSGRANASANESSDFPGHSMTGSERWRTITNDTRAST